MTRYKKQGYRKTFINDRGVKSSRQFFVKTVSYNQMITEINAVICRIKATHATAK